MGFKSQFDQYNFLKHIKLNSNQINEIYIKEKYIKNKLVILQMLIIIKFSILAQMTKCSLNILNKLFNLS